MFGEYTSPDYGTTTYAKIRVTELRLTIDLKVESVMNKIAEFRILDLFCGAGGFSYGMH